MQESCQEKSRNGQDGMGGSACELDLTYVPVLGSRLHLLLLACRTAAQAFARPAVSVGQAYS